MVDWVTATQFRLGNDHYVVRPAAAQHEGLKKAEATIVTVFDFQDASCISAEVLEDRLESYLGADDVFQREFLQGVMIIRGMATQVDQSVADLFVSWGTKWIQEVLGHTLNHSLSIGPYVLDVNGLSQIWKLYDDFNKAFLVSTWPSQTVEGEVSCSDVMCTLLTSIRSYENLRVSASGYTHLAIAVPSRLYFRKTNARPLAGARIAVKDIFHLKGVKTSCCSRGYHDLYPAQDATALSIQTLVDLGAQIVGKTHLSSFALREEPTECIDYQAPFNPRADGYQSPAGSSSGSGAAIASYDWLDFTLGTDTTGSGRRPALWNGAFGLRPSAHLLSSDGMVATCPTLDSPCLFGRELGRFKEIVPAWYKRQLKPPGDSELPWAILYPTDFLPVANAEQMRAINDFTLGLSRYLKVSPRKISLTESWSKTSPVEEKVLDVFMQNVQEHGFFYDAYHCFDDFRRDHEERFGRPAYVTEVVRWMWGIARLLNGSQHDEALKRFAIFRQWLIDEILQTKKQRAVMILPIERLEPRYRDTPPEIPSVPPMSINVLFISPTLGGPELTVPIAEVAFMSRITDRMEYLPCAVSLLGAPDTDLQLIEMVQAFLEDVGRPTSVHTGSSMGPAFEKHRQVPQTTTSDEPWLA